MFGAFAPTRLPSKNAFAAKSSQSIEKQVLCKKVVPAYLVGIAWCSMVPSNILQTIFCSAEHRAGDFEYFFEKMGGNYVWEIIFGEVIVLLSL